MVFAAVNNLRFNKIIKNISFSSVFYTKNKQKTVHEMLRRITQSHRHNQIAFILSANWDFCGAEIRIGAIPFIHKTERFLKGIDSNRFNRDSSSIRAWRRVRIKNTRKLTVTCHLSKIDGTFMTSRPNRWWIATTSFRNRFFERFEFRASGEWAKNLNFFRQLWLQICTHFPFAISIA